MQDKKFWESKKFIMQLAAVIATVLMFVAPEVVEGLGTENQAIAIIGTLLSVGLYVLAQAGNDNERIKMQKQVEAELARLIAKYDGQVVQVVQAELARLLEELGKK
jgi:hypothetical protein